MDFRFLATLGMTERRGRIIPANPFYLPLSAPPVDTRLRGYDGVVLREGSAPILNSYANESLTVVPTLPGTYVLSPLPSLHWPYPINVSRPADDTLSSPLEISERTSLRGEETARSHLRRLAPMVLSTRPSTTLRRGLWVGHLLLYKGSRSNHQYRTSGLPYDSFGNASEQ